MLAVSLLQPASADSLEAARDAILTQIDAGQYEQAQQAVSQMETNFTGQAKLARRVWEAANRYDKVEAFDYSRTLCERIVAKYPQDIYATYAALQLAKLNVYKLIDAGDYKAAQAAVSDIIVDFAGHKQHSRRLYEIANWYQSHDALTQAKDLYTLIAEDYPSDKYGKNAALQKAKLDVYDLIDQGKHTLVDSAVSQIAVDFASHPDLAKRLWEIAKKYDKLKGFDYSKVLCERIIQADPDAEYASYAALQLAKLKAFDLIEAGDVNEANAAVSKIMDDFEGHPELTRRLYELAQKFVREDARSYGEALHARLAADFPKDKYGSRSVIQAAKLQIYDLIDANALPAADAALFKMEVQFAGHELLYEQLDSVGEKYEMAGDIDTACAIYQKVTQNCPADAAGSVSAAGRLAKYDLFNAIEAGDGNQVETMIQQIGTALPVNGGLDDYLNLLGQSCYAKGWSLRLQGGNGLADDYFAAAIKLWERIFTEFPDSPLAPAACFSAAAQSAQELGDYDKAIQYFQKTADDWPWYQYADWAQFKVAEYFEIMVDEGVLDPHTAEPVITAALQAVIDKYPGSEWTKQAQLMLEHYRPQEPNSPVPQQLSGSE